MLQRLPRSHRLGVDRSQGARLVHGGVGRLPQVWRQPHDVCPDRRHLTLRHAPDDPARRQTVAFAWPADKPAPSTQALSFIDVPLASSTLSDPSPPPMPIRRACQLARPSSPVGQVLPSSAHQPVADDQPDQLAACPSPGCSPSDAVETPSYALCSLHHDCALFCSVPSAGTPEQALSTLPKCAHGAEAAVRKRSKLALRRETESQRKRSRAWMISVHNCHRRVLSRVACVAAVACTELRTGGSAGNRSGGRYALGQSARGHLPTAPRIRWDRGGDDARPCEWRASALAKGRG